MGEKKRRRDRLIGLSEPRPEWAVGFSDECWWSRVALLTLSSWSEKGKPERLLQRSIPKDDPEPKARSATASICPNSTGDVVEVRGWEAGEFHNQAVPFVVLREAPGGRQESAAHLGQRELANLQRGQALALISQPRSQEERARSKDRELPKQSPWLNAIEPKWIHGKRKVTEPERLLGAYELADRVCGVFGCPHYEHLSIPQEVA